MELVFRFSWIIIIIIIGINLLIFRLRARKYLEDKHEVKQKTNIFYWNVFIFINLPFVIIGFGQLTGHINYAYEFLEPKSSNLFFVLYVISIIIMWAKATNWIFNKNGAIFLSEHPEILLQNIFKSKKSFPLRTVKIALIIILILGISGNLVHFFDVNL